MQPAVILKHCQSRLLAGEETVICSDCYHTSFQLLFLCVLQLSDMEEQVMDHQAQHTSTIQLDQADLQTEVSKLTYQEGRMLLLEVAKATIGTKKVQQICDTLVKLFFFNGPNLFSRLSHDELGHDEHFQEIGVLTGSRPASMTNIHASNCIWLRVPGLQPEKLCSLLNVYEALFQAELEMRGFSLYKDTDGFWYEGGHKIEQWFLAHE